MIPGISIRLKRLSLRRLLFFLWTESLLEFFFCTCLRLVSDFVRSFLSGPSMVIFGAYDSWLGGSHSLRLMICFDRAFEEPMTLFCEILLMTYLMGDSGSIGYPLVE